MIDEFDPRPWVPLMPGAVMRGPTYRHRTKDEIVYGLDLRLDASLDQITLVMHSGDSEPAKVS